MRGLSTPQAWQMGWLAVQQLDGASLGPGQPVTVQLPPQTSSERSGLRVVPSWAPPEALPLFAGYRVTAGVDAALPEEAAGKVHIHSSAIAHYKDSKPTTWLAALGGARRCARAAAAVGQRWLRCGGAGRAAAHAATITRRPRRRPLWLPAAVGEAYYDAASGVTLQFVRVSSSGAATLLVAREAPKQKKKAA